MRNRKMVVKFDRFRKVKQCHGCALIHHRRSQVVGRGSIPAKLLFIGESPGKTEDLIGDPFVGVAGKLIDKMIEDACLLAECESPSYYLTNAVLCRAWDWGQNSEHYGMNREPKKIEILACKKNILEIAHIVKPEIVVFIGTVARTYYGSEFPNHARITHPEIHMKYGGYNCGQASPFYSTDIRTLSDLFRRYM